MRLGQIDAFKTCFLSPKKQLYLFRWSPFPGRIKGKRFAIIEPKRRILSRPATVMLGFDGRMVVRYAGRELGYRGDDRASHPCGARGQTEATQIHSASGTPLAAATGQGTLTVSARGGDPADGKSGNIYVALTV